MATYTKTKEGGLEMEKSSVETITLEAGEKSVTMTGEEFDEATDRIINRNPVTSPVQLAMFDGIEVDENIFRIKGGEIELHDFDGPIKLGKTFEVIAKVYVDEVKAKEYEKDGLVRSHILVIDEVKTRDR